MRAALLCLFVASSALAQVNEVSSADLSRGATLMPSSAAYADQASAGVYNPAGISHVGALELLYAHERSIARGQTIDGIYLAGNPLGLVATGLSLEWLRGGSNDHRKVSWQLAAGPEAFSVGVGFNWFTGGTVDGLFSVDLGVQSRFSRYFSIGVALKNVDAPTRGAVAFARKLDVGVGIRPFGERFTLGIDWVVDDQRGASYSQMAYSLQAMVVKGFTVYAGASHGFSAAQQLMLQIGFTVDLPNFGVGYALSGSSSGFNHLITSRLSIERAPSLPIASDVIAVISLSNLGEPVSSGTVSSLLGVPPDDRYLRTVITLRDAAKDVHLKGVVLKVDSSGVGFGRAKELRDAVQLLRTNGKTVIAYILNATDADYFIASAADQIFAAPEGMLLVDGLQSNILFLGGTAEKLGVTVDVARVGAYKNSPDQFTRTDMSPEQREAISAYLDTDVREISAAVTASRHLTAEEWAASIDEGLKSCQRARELKLIDEVLAPAAAEKRIAELIPHARLIAKYPEETERTGRWGSQPRIAVIPVVGTISGGASGQDPLGLSTSAGADSFIRAIESAASDSQVRAIVLRIDSPGGDGLASDLMYRAVLEAKKKKPVVASMGDVAASGGYYASMGADEIWAEPTTITGSIGVFFIKPSVKGLAEKLGVNQESVTRGALAGITDYYQPWTEPQRAAAQKWVDAFYDNFITEVASSRGKTKDEIDKVARGRVWSGADAIERGLVDHLGGFAQAIDSAKERAHLGDDFSIQVYGPTGGLLASLVAGSVLDQPLREATISVAPQSPLPAMARELGFDQLQLSAGLKAHLGYGLTVK